MHVSLFQRAQQIFTSIVELAPKDRPAALDAACAGDADLVSLVTGLLSADDAAPSAGWALSPGPTSGIAVGDTIEKYQVLYQLGTGGMAEVWAVRHALLGTDYALKVLHQGIGPLQQRLLKEGRAQARLRHPNIVPVWDVLDLSGCPALLMPLVDGPTLRTLMQEQSLTVPEIIELIRGINEGVCYAHSQDLIHRDLKPSNILLERQHGRLVPRVADFGLVKDTPTENTAGDTIHGVFMGTPAYAAPEQLEDTAAVTGAADLFSLGVIFYELLVGRLPFQGRSPVAVALAQQAQPDLAGIEPALRGIVAGLLDRDPHSRLGGAALRRRLDALPALTGTGQQRLVARLPEQTSVTDPLHRDNLPAPRDGFLGRSEALDRLSAALADARLVTVTGPGGVGKTRLALELGLQQRTLWPGGIWFCDLAEARDAGSACVAIASALGVSAGRDPAAAVRRTLEGRPETLLILDNLEQIAIEAATLLDGWLNVEGGARFLCTSRSPLRLRGERQVPLAPMSADDAFALFAERASAVRPGLDADEERGDIVELVEMLDRLPLAIELAAARVRLASPQRLRARLSQRFKLLTSRSPAVPDRQKTLRATIQWSWDLLAPHEQSALAQCSVFEGAFSLEDAAEVIALDDEYWIEDVLTELIDQSLLGCQRTGEAPRLSMLVSIQQFAAEQRADPDTVVRHGRHYARLGGARLNELNRAGGLAYKQQLLSARTNLIAATRRAITRGDTEIAVRCYQAAAICYQSQGPFREGLQLAETLERMPLSDALRIDLATCTTSMRVLNGLAPLAQQRLREALALARGLGAPAPLARVLCRLGAVQGHQNQLDECEASFREALTLARANGLANLEVTSLRCLANLINDRHGTERAEAAYREAFESARRNGDLKQESHCLINLTEIELMKGNGEAALEMAERCRVLAHRRREKITESFVLVNLSEAHRLCGRPRAALSVAEEGLVLAEALGSNHILTLIRYGLGNLFAQLGELDKAAASFRAAIEMARPQGRRATLIRLAEVHRRAGDLDAARAAWGSLVSTPDATDHDHSYHRGGLAEISLDAGDLDAARDGFAQALALADGEPRLSARWMWGQARLQARTEELAPALELTAAAAELLRAGRRRWDLSRLLCDRAAIALQLGDRATAQAALQEAGALDSSLHQDHPSALTETLRTLSAAISTTATRP